MTDRRSGRSRSISNKGDRRSSQNQSDRLARSASQSYTGPDWSSQQEDWINLGSQVNEHRQRLSDVEKDLNVDMPDQHTQEWSNFSAEILSEYEDKHGLGNSRLLGDILYEGTNQAHGTERNSEEYKKLMAWVLKKWKKRNSGRIQRNVQFSHMK